jgi:hypothetical protein
MADRSNIGTKDMQLRASQSRGAFQIPKCLMYQIVERKIYNLERSNSEVHNKPGFRWVCASFSQLEYCLRSWLECFSSHKL